VELSDIKRGDLFGQPPTNWWERLACRAQGAKTFHWGWLMSPIIENGQIVDWATSEAISTGVDVTRLAGRHVYVKRIKTLPEIAPDEAIDIQSEYGDLPYDWEVDVLSAIWYAFKYYLGKPFPFIKTKGLNCLQWVICYAAERGVTLFPPDQYPTEKALESSPLIDNVGEVNI
jgi:hypothetical protein